MLQLQCQAHQLSVTTSTIRAYTPAVGNYLMWCSWFHPMVTLPKDPVKAAGIIGEFAMYSFQHGFNKNNTGNCAGTVKPKLSAVSM